MSEKNRRKVLKSIAAGGGAVVIGKSLPDRWAKPVVDAVVLPAHAETTDDTGSQPTTTVAPTTTPCTPCLVAETYCTGAGEGSLYLEVAVDGTVSLSHSNSNEILTDSVDPCAGGAFSFQFPSPGGGTISISGTIPCGPTSSITVQYSDGQQNGTRDMTTDACIPG